MTRSEFLKLLDELKIDRNIISFEDNIKDGYCVRKNHYRWEVCFRERGNEHNLIGFPSESDALQSLYDELFKIYSK